MPMRIAPANYCIHQSVRPVTGLAGASPAPARPAGDACVRRNGDAKVGANAKAGAAVRGGADHRCPLDSKPLRLRQGPEVVLGEAAVRRRASGGAAQTGNRSDGPHSRSS